MLQNLKKILKKILGNKFMILARPAYHGFKSLVGKVTYGNPSSKLILVGITGTKGKTSTTTYIGRMLNSLGIPTGYITTGSIYTGQKNELVNDIKILKEIESRL